MGLYTRRILPWAIDWTMGNRRARERRARLLPAAEGRVLELGVGSGHNLAFYGPGVREVVGIDPSRELLAMARRRAGGHVRLVEARAEALPFEAGDFDTVVTTWTLCSVADLGRALAEARRVLRPGGALLFVEHGRAPEASVARWQRRLDPLWTRLAGGCHLDRPIERVIGEAGFRLLGLEADYLPATPRLLGYTYQGAARPA